VGLINLPNMPYLIGSDKVEKSTKMVMEFHSYHYHHTTFFTLLLLLGHPLTPPYVGVLVHL
jgi:hypothetical protein